MPTVRTRTFRAPAADDGGGERRVAPPRAAGALTAPSYLLDTSVVIELRDRHPDVQRRVETFGPAVRLSIVTRIELEGDV